jgi:hypothetical protein
MINPLEQEINDAYITELRFELSLQMRNHVIEWSRQFQPRFFFAAYSATVGAWDDVKKDLRRGRISKKEATCLIDKMFQVKLINQSQYGFYLGQFEAIEATQIRYNS